MYGFEEPAPRGCKECKEYVRIQKTYDEYVGCVHGSKLANIKRTDRPEDCPMIDLEDDGR